jgi:hypothetical protein
VTPDRPGKIDDAGRIIEVARATTEGLRRAWTYPCGVADRPRLDAAGLDHEQARAARFEGAQQHRRIAVRVIT